MLGNLHVRFGERRVETGHREVARRYAPTLPLGRGRTFSLAMADRLWAADGHPNPLGPQQSEGPERREILSAAAARSA